jgi:hypothetical protein
MKKTLDKKVLVGYRNGDHWVSFIDLSITLVHNYNTIKTPRRAHCERRRRRIDMARVGDGWIRTYVVSVGRICCFVT